MKRYIIAFVATLSLIANAAFTPVFTQWYEQQTGITPVALYIIGFIIGICQIGISIVLWICALEGVSVKDFIKDNL